MTFVRFTTRAVALVALGFSPGLAACAGTHPGSTASARGGASASAPPSTSDDRGPGSEHEAALARLVDAPWGTRLDKRRTLSMPLPDADRWTHVKFWGVTTVAGWRYGDDHHAVVAAFAFASKKAPATVDSCSARFIGWGRSNAAAFELSVGEPRIDEVPWLGGPAGARVRIYVLDAERRSVFGLHRYPSAFAVYPAWNDACLVVGISVPADDWPELAGTLRDRLVRDALPALVAKPGVGKVALEAEIDVDE